MRLVLNTVGNSITFLRLQVVGLDKWFLVAGWLLVFDILFMTRFYALSNFCEAALFAIFVLESSLRRQLLDEMKSRTLVPLMSFLGWIAISGIWSPADWLQVISDVLDWRKLLLFPIGLVIFRNGFFRTLGLSMTIGVGVLFLLLGLMGLILDTEVWSRAPHSVLQNYSAQGYYFSVIGLVLVTMGSLGRDLSSFARWSAICLGLGFVLFVVFTSPSRAAYMAFVVNMALICYVLFSQRVYGLIFGIALSAVLLSLSPMTNSRLTLAVNELAGGLALSESNNAITSADVPMASGSVRMVFWLNTIDMIIENPILGTGAAGFEEGYSTVVVDDEGWSSIVTNDPHSQYLHIAAEYGLVGLSLFLLFFVLLLLEADTKTVWGLCLLSVILVSGSISLIVGALGAFIEGRITVLLLALFFSLKRFQSS